MIKKQSRDVDADVYPQFYIEPGPKIRVYAEASNNPKQLEDTKTYYALFQGTFDPISKEWTVSSARAITAKENELLQSASEASCCFETLRCLARSFQKRTPMQRNHLLTKRNRFFDPMNRNSNIWTRG